jgi:hypothetical protein
VYDNSREASYKFKILCGWPSLTIQLLGDHPLPISLKELAALRGSLKHLIPLGHGVSENFWINTRKQGIRGDDGRFGQDCENKTTGMSKKVVDISTFKKRT